MQHCQESEQDEDSEQDEEVQLCVPIEDAERQQAEEIQQHITITVEGKTTYG